MPIMAPDTTCTILSNPIRKDGETPDQRYITKMKIIKPSKKESVFCCNENEKKLNVKVQMKRETNKNLFDRTILNLSSDL